MRYKRSKQIPQENESDANESLMLVWSERRNDATMDVFPTPLCPVNITVYHSSCPPPFSSFRPPPLNVSAFPLPVWSRDRKWGSSFGLDESSSVWSVPSVQGSSRCLKLVKLRTCRKYGPRLSTISWSTAFLQSYTRYTILLQNKNGFCWSCASRT